MARVWEVTTLVEAQEQAASAGQETYYTVNRIGGWLSRWAELVEMAAPTAGSTSRIEPAPGRPRGSFVLPPSLKATTIKADIEMAWDALHPSTVEYRYVYLLMQGYPIMTAGDLLRIRRKEAFNTYWGAVRAMARHLGWTEADGE